MIISLNQISHTHNTYCNCWKHLLQEVFKLWRPETLNRDDWWTVLSLFFQVLFRNSRKKLWNPCKQHSSMGLEDSCTHMECDICLSSFYKKPFGNKKQTNCAILFLELLGFKKYIIKQSEYLLKYYFCNKYMECCSICII